MTFHRFFLTLVIAIFPMITHASDASRTININIVGENIPRGSIFTVFCLTDLTHVRNGSNHGSTWISHNNMQNKISIKFDRPTIIRRNPSIACHINKTNFRSNELPLYDLANRNTINFRLKVVSGDVTKRNGRKQIPNMTLHLEKMP